MYGIEYVSTEEPFRCLRLSQQLAVPAPEGHSAIIFPLILHENMATGNHSYVQSNKETKIFLENNHKRGHHFYFKRTKAVPKKNLSTDCNFLCLLFSWFLFILVSDLQPAQIPSSDYSSALQPD